MGMAEPRWEAREGFAAVPGGRVWYRIVGGGDGIPLLTVHGGPGFPHDYLESLERLAPDRSVVFYDQLGCGKSDRPADPTLWQLERFVAELAEVRDSLHLDRFHLLGHSWGAMVATDYVLTRPAGLASLILASPCLSSDRWLQDLARRRADLPPEIRDVLDSHEAAGTIDAREYRGATMEFYRRHMCLLDPWPEAMQRSQAGFNPSIYNALWGPNEFLMTGNLAGYDRTARLREIAVPTLFTCGQDDECLPGTTAWYRSLLPGSELAVFQASSHMPHLEEPDLYLHTVRDFLRRADRRAGATEGRCPH